MNLAWLAAILAPSDVAPANSRHGLTREEPGHLAAVVLGWQWLLYETQDGPSPSGGAVDLVALSLRSDSIVTATAELVDLLTSAETADLAKATSLALMTCSAAVELDDYEACLKVLDAQLDRTQRADTSDGALLRAALLQQKALRLRDFGRDYQSISYAAASELAKVEPDQCSVFEVAHPLRDSIGTIRRIGEDLAASIVSLLPHEDPSASPLSSLAKKFEVRSTPHAVGRAQRNRAQTYAQYVAQVFKDSFGSQTYVIGGSERPDLFYSVLSLELLGHSSVYSARKELALLRLVQAGGDRAELSDSLRLLRHASAKNELDQALRRIRAAGPLAALSEDARQILRTRLAPGLLRTVELRVLQVASELLAPAEARMAFDAIRELLSHGPPGESPPAWDLPISRLEIAWSAAAALANVCGAASEAAEFLLEVTATQAERTELFDRSMQLAIHEIEWGDVSLDVLNAWIRFVDSDSTLPRLAETVHSFAHVESPGTTVVSGDLSPIISVVNAAIRRGGGGDLQLPEGAHALVIQALADIRESASRGHYSGGGTSPGEVAAAMIVLGAGDPLWNPLAEFLLDNRVQRADRSPAFERLARSGVSLPPRVADQFGAQVPSLMAARDVGWGESAVVPYPSALRFVASHTLTSTASSYDAIAGLAGAADRASRREAATTVAVLATRRPGTLYLAIALSLARDEDVEVRASAGAALASLARPEEELSGVALARLVELLAEDGLLVPLRVVSALKEAPVELDDRVRREVRRVADEHPSRNVRRRAEEVLRDRSSVGEVGDGAN